MKNGVLLQAFEWYLEADQQHYKRLQAALPDLAARGISAIWLPPVCKATGPEDVGYGIYDLYDLGEFEQKGAIASKYGKKAELLALIESAHDLNLQVYADVVLNHKAGADRTEACQAVEVNPQNREERIAEAKEIEAWTYFDFPGRKGAYSDFVWHWYHFTGVDYDAREEKKGLYRLLGENKYWSEAVSQENGNFDYLMFADIDHSHPEVRAELLHWAKWFIQETKIDGFRLDAAKHIDANFMRDFVGAIAAEQGKNFFFVAEYWENNEATLDHYLAETENQLAIFDVVLHFHFHEASQAQGHYDLRRIFDGTAVQNDPLHAVTFVENHDSQPDQALASTVEAWFKPLAYALILLRQEGYPCVFWADLFGSGDGQIPAQTELLHKLLNLRQNYAKGEQNDYWEREDLIGWVRRGEGEEQPLAVLMTIREAQELRMFVGEKQAGQRYVDVIHEEQPAVTIGEDGFGLFTVPAGSLSCWVREDCEI